MFEITIMYGAVATIFVIGLAIGFIKSIRAVIVLGGLSLVFVGGRNPSNYGENYTLTRESKIALSDYVSNLDKDERENLTTHIKLYGDIFESDSESLKLINKYLIETVGR